MRKGWEGAELGLTHYVSVPRRMGLFERLFNCPCQSPLNSPTRHSLPPCAMCHAAAARGSVVVVAGDFNTAPYSPLYQFMSQGQLDLSRHCKKKISGGCLVYGSG